MCARAPGLSGFNSGERSYLLQKYEVLSGWEIGWEGGEGEGWVAGGRTTMEIGLSLQICPLIDIAS